MTAALPLPALIQGGMGVGVSNWRLARAVSLHGHLGVVSGTCIDSVLIRRLADGDPGGHMRRALAAFPIQEIAQEALDKFFYTNGRAPGEKYPSLPMYRHVVKKFTHDMSVLANFVEVWLAKQGHDGVVGINLLTKVQMPNLPSLYGAMLAGVDYVLMGAGIPKEIPGALDKMANHEPASIRLDVEGEPRGEATYLDFDPATLWDKLPAALHRPMFLPIVASNSLATMLARKANGRVDGFIVEGPTAGGHNAPPRGERVVNEKGEPQYSHRDEVDLEKLGQLGLPFWVAGGAGRPGEMERIQGLGGAGIQVGTLFAFCEESGIEENVKRDVVRQCAEGTLEILTDGRASPTGFPFKVVQAPESLANPVHYEARERVCDLGYLRTAYRTERGKVNFRCASEPVDTYVKKGGTAEGAAGRKCLCNALMADIGLGQARGSAGVEMPLLTAGDDVEILGAFLNGRDHYTAADVIKHLCGSAKVQKPSQVAAD